jgi:hypothetical protein
VFQIPSGFEHRHQRTVDAKRHTLPDPLKGKLTCEPDRAVITQLRECATGSRAFTLASAWRSVLAAGPVGAAATWGSQCWSYVSGVPWLNTRAVSPGRTVMYRLTPVEKAAHLDAHELLRDGDAAHMQRVHSSAASADSTPPNPPPRREPPPNRIRKHTSTQTANALLMV